MNIVFVIDNFANTTNGTNVTARRFYDELIKQGHHVRVVSFGIEGENMYNLKESYFPVISNIAKRFHITFAKFDKKVLEEAYQGADIVHLFLPFVLQVKALKLAQKMGITTTAAFHLHPLNMLENVGFRNSKFISSIFFWYFKKTFYDKVDHIHCPSQFTADELVRHKYKAKLHVISNGVAPCFAPPEPKASILAIEETQPKETFHILTVGRFAAEKRQDILIKAVGASKYKDKIHLYFAGGGPLEKKYKRLSKKYLTNQPTFKFLQQNELLEKIHESDLYVHCAEVEIEGISCLEAFSGGLVPVIGKAPKSATWQFALDDRCRFDINNYQELTQKIDYWIEHPEELQAMRERYIEYAKNFTLEQSVERTVHMFEEAMGKKASHVEQKRELSMTETDADSLQFIEQESFVADM